MLRAGHAAGITSHGRWRRIRSVDSYFIRVLVAALALTVPVSVLLGLLVSNFGVQLSTQQAEARTQATAAGSAIRITDWLAERKSELRILAAHEVGEIEQGALVADLEAAGPSYTAYDALQIISPGGKVIASTQAGTDPLLAGSLLKGALVSETLQPIQIIGGKPSWIMSAPIIGSGGTSEAVVVGDLAIGVLGRLIDPYGRTPSGAGQEVHIANAEGYILYSSDWGFLTDDSAIVSHGAFSLKANPHLVAAGHANGSGVSQAVDYRGHHVIAGYQVVPSLGWVVIASTDTAVALAAVYDEQVKTSLLQALGFVMFVGFAVVLAALMTRPVVALSRAAEKVEAGDLNIRVPVRGSREMRRLGETFNAMIERLGGMLGRLRGEVTDSATKLSSAAEQLASATYEQTTAATATSASMEELSRSSVSIADTIDRVAIQAGEVRSNLELAQTDLRASGERTLALAGRVNEIESILALINDIADQTSLLALNAAIEAARAGEAGRGFAVVADEVRRLAERSRIASAQIAKLVEGAQAQSTETVMALEKGVKQMERGLGMMQAMAEVSGQVQQATQQQRASTEDVVRAIEHIAEGSRSIAATAQEIAAAAARQGSLAAELAGSQIGVGSANNAG